jgi:hypothetical protein
MAEPETLKGLAAKPRSARLLFKFRPAIHWAVALSTFALATYLLALVFPLWLACLLDIAAIALWFFTFFYVARENTEKSEFRGPVKTPDKAEIIRDMNYDLTIAKLDAALAAERAKVKPPPEVRRKTKRELLEEDLEEFHTGFLGAEDLADRALKEAELEFKDNPVRLEKERRVIKVWRKRHLPE